MTSVLLVADDTLLRESTSLALGRYGYEVHTAVDGDDGWARFRALCPDVTLVDVLLPGLGGLSLVHLIRAESRLPLLVFAARTNPVDIVLGLEAGADDYVTKPFDVPVLVARIRSVLRRVGPPPGVAPPRTPPMRFGDLLIDPVGFMVRRSGRLLGLTPTELRLLLVFAAQPAVALSRTELLESVWGYSGVGDGRVVNIHVQRLRSKIGRDRITTVRGYGYCFEP